MVNPLPKLAAALLMLTALSNSGARAELRQALPNRTVQVSLNFSFTLPSEVALNQSGFAVTEGTRKAVYEFAIGECRLLLATIASSCQLTNVNVNIHEQRLHQPAPYLQVNGNGSYAITLRVN